MIGAIRRQVSIYGAMAAIMPKMFMAYSIWVWMSFFVQIIAMIIFVAFWRAIYAEEATIAGLSLQQTLNYILLAQIFETVMHSPSMIYRFGWLLRQGEMAIVLLRPLDFQAAEYVSNVGEVVMNLTLQIPMVIIAILFFDLRLPTNPAVWAAFVLTLFLGHALLFCFDWILACLAFYITEIWGLSVLRFGLSLFLGGTLVPLVMMPEWLRQITAASPFAQALYTPVALLTGITPLSAAPRVWLTQLIYLLVLLVLSRLVFKAAVRKITVQGG
jgi:ABC-2 type transport system permease protein